MGYEIFSRKVRRVGTPQIAFMRNGRIAFNKAATQLLVEQAVESVLLMWDKANRKVAMRPIAKKDPRAYKVHISKRDNGAGFSAVTFLEHLGIDYEKGTQSFPIAWNSENALFEVSLSEGTTASEQQTHPLLASVGSRGRK